MKNEYIKRDLETKIKEFCNYFPVIGLTGPRQSGKSTLLRKAFPHHKYVTFDDHKAVELLHDDPERFMEIYNNKVIFDEVQKVPEFFNNIKIAVDNDRSNYGKFILTGSSQFKLNKNISESLAGRIGLLTLLPFNYSEIQYKKKEDLIFKGSFPELYTREYKGFDYWYSSYIDTYLEKDLRSISNIGDLRDFRKFISLLAANTSQVLNMSSYSRDLGIAVSTIKRWLSVLEAAYIIFLLPPYYNNYGKRITKSPKVYFWDTGLASYLTGVYTKELYEKGPLTGPLFENYSISEIIKKDLHSGLKSNFYYLRTNNGDEIDLIMEKRREVSFFEIKSSKTFKPLMTKQIEKYSSETQTNYVLYAGEDTPFTEKINVMNIFNYLDM